MMSFTMHLIEIFKNAMVTILPNFGFLKLWQPGGVHEKPNTVGEI